MNANNFSDLSDFTAVEPRSQISCEPALQPLEDTAITARTQRRMLGMPLEKILLQIRSGIVICDAGGLIVLADAHARQLACRDPEGTPLDLSEDTWGVLQDLNGGRVALEEWPFMRALRGETLPSKEFRLLRRDGTASDILFSATPIVNAERRISGVAATLTDVSGQKREETLRHELALERERSRMATHIHDTVSQTLTAIALQLQAAERELGQNSSAGIYLQRAMNGARHGLADLRRCIWTLSHESLDGEDLAEALSFLAEQIFAATSVDLRLSLHPESDALPREVRHEMLWIGKEALVNILKHAQATQVDIELVCGSKEVLLRIHDNGQGFGPVRALSNSKGSFGLIGMRKRAQRLGGSIVLDSYPGKGTRVIAVVPCMQQHLAA